MGSWRRVMIVGTCGGLDVEPLREAVMWDVAGDSAYGPLSSSGGACSLPVWPDKEFCVVGNLFERGYGPHAIADDLRRLSAIGPSLRCKVHVGIDDEGDACQCTVELDGGLTRVLAPEIPVIPHITPSQMRDAMLAQLRSRRR